MSASIYTFLSCFLFLLYFVRFICVTYTYIEMYHFFLVLFFHLLDVMLCI